MIVYNVTLNVDEKIHQEWLQWMREVHIPEVLATGLFIEHKFLRLLSHEAENTGFTYAVQYFLPDLPTYETYRLHYAPALQAQTTAKFGDKVVAFRTILETVE
ncbi:MAG: DUF4286 family protein [Microscillaceae bacterium]|nr:DUF4286 family protein [Microscillaceae bacterium]MDW8460850.1 DUF4286 family protein [Cytophagales bacterium]